MEDKIQFNLQLFAAPDSDAGAVDVGEDFGDFEDDFDDLLFDDDDLDDSADEGDEPADEMTLEGAEQEEAAQAPPDAGQMQMLALARKQAEAEAWSRAQQEKDALVAQAYGGQVNPYTGRPINNEAELRLYQQAYREEQQQQALAAAGLSPAMLNQMIESNPAVQQAKAMVAQQQQVMGQQALDAQIRAISAIDPDIKGLGDITKMETFNQFDALVRQGYALVDAYKLANFDTLAAKRAGAARQRALNQTAGKAHLQPTQGKASGQAVTVPPDVRAMYREMNPGISDKEIAKHYARTMRE